MSQDLTVNIKTTSDVPQAMDRAKAATVGFGKQVEDIQKKFSMAFKDVFLSFLGPLALLGVAMNYIGKLIDDNRKKHEEANQAAIDGTNALMSAEDKYYANKLNKEKELRETTEEAKTQRETTTQEFLEKDPRGQAMLKELQFKSMSDPVGQVAFRKQKVIQDQVQAIIAEDMKKNPTAGATAGKEAAAAAFKGPEGFSNVVGVGANPVMEAMNLQLEEAQKQTALLEKIASPEGGVPKDFTKDTK
tara:strand:+ start:348 stop:1085 length:738 start_codon:yes stop_codon:yes gene_type:complete